MPMFFSSDSALPRASFDNRSNGRSCSACLRTAVVDEPVFIVFTPSVWKEASISASAAEALTPAVSRPSRGETGSVAQPAPGHAASARAKPQIAPADQTQCRPKRFL